MYDRVLFPTDGSPGTEEATVHAMDLARRYRASLHVLHVIDTSILPLEQHSQEIVTQLEYVGLESVQDVVRDAETAGIESVTEVVTRGTPYRAILDYVTENDIGLVLMVTHGRSGWQRYLLGSVTARVIRMSDFPVLTVPTIDADWA